MDKSVKTSWKKKMQIKNEKKSAKECEQEIKVAKQQIIEVFLSIMNSNLNQMVLI